MNREGHVVHRQAISWALSQTNSVGKCCRSGPLSNRSSIDRQIIERAAARISCSKLPVPACDTEDPVGSACSLVRPIGDRMAIQIQRDVVRLNTEAGLWRGNVLLQDIPPGS